MSGSGDQCVNRLVNSVIEAFYNEDNNVGGAGYVRQRLERLKAIVDEVAAAKGISLSPAHSPLPPKDKEEADEANFFHLPPLCLGWRGSLDNNDENSPIPESIYVLADVAATFYKLRCVYSFRLSETGVLRLYGKTKADNRVVVILIDLKTLAMKFGNDTAVSLLELPEDLRVTSISLLTDEDPVAVADVVLRFVRAVARENPLLPAPVLQRLLDPRMVHDPKTSPAVDRVYRYEMTYTVLVVTPRKIVLSTPRTNGIVNVDVMQETYLIGPPLRDMEWKLDFLFPTAPAAETVVMLDPSLPPPPPSNVLEEEEDDSIVDDTGVIYDSEGDFDSVAASAGSSNSESSSTGSDDDDDEEIVDEGKKRAREKPVSTRSLRSRTKAARFSNESEERRRIARGGDRVVENLDVYHADDDPEEREQDRMTDAAELQVFLQRDDAEELDLAKGFSRSDWARKQFQQPLNLIRQGAHAPIFDQLLDYDGDENGTCISRNKPSARTPEEIAADKTAKRPSKQPRCQDYRRCVMCDGVHPCADTLWIRGVPMPVGTKCSALADAILYFIGTLRELAATEGNVTSADAERIKRAFAHVVAAHANKSGSGN
jgi:hypothetical protein